MIQKMDKIQEMICGFSSYTTQVLGKEIDLLFLLIFLLYFATLMRYLLNKNAPHGRCCSSSRRHALYSMLAGAVTVIMIDLSV
jgi:hypothetical protein